MFILCFFNNYLFVILSQCLIKNEELTYQQTKGDQQTEEGEKEGILGKQKKCCVGCIAHSDRHICSHHAVHLLKGASKCIEFHGF